MSGTLGVRLRRIALLGAVFHALVLAAAPFEHHDLVCHLKTPQHCLSCNTSPVGASDHAQPVDSESQLADAGSAIARQAAPNSALLTPRRPGRSPPFSV
jgi:hypothetical protein